MTYKPDKEPFLSRWSKRKHDAREEEAREKPKTEPPPAQEPGAERKKDGQSPPPELPPVERLDYDSDYRAFLDPRVNEQTRRSALKKLFADARFNVMDGLDVYIDDYSKSDPIPAAMLASLQQAQNILEWAKGNDKSSARESGESAGAHAPQEATPGDEKEGPASIEAGEPPRTAQDEQEQGAETTPGASGEDDSRRNA